MEGGKGVWLSFLLAGFLGFGLSVCKLFSSCPPFSLICFLLFFVLSVLVVFLLLLFLLLLVLLFSSYGVARRRSFGGGSGSL